MFLSLSLCICPLSDCPAPLLADEDMVDAHVPRMPVAPAFPEYTAMSRHTRGRTDLKPIEVAGPDYVMHKADGLAALPPVGEDNNTGMSLRPSNGYEDSSDFFVPGMKPAAPAPSEVASEIV